MTYFEVSPPPKKTLKPTWNVTEKRYQTPRITFKTYEATWGKLPHNRSESIGFSLAIGRHFLIATLPGTNELPINMDGWNTSLSEKGFQFFFRGKLLVSAREKNTSQPLKIELGYPTLCVIELTITHITHHPKEPKKYRLSKIMF